MRKVIFKAFIIMFVLIFLASRVFAFIDFDHPATNVILGITFAVLGYSQSSAADGYRTACKENINMMGVWTAYAVVDANYAGYYEAKYDDWGGSYYYGLYSSYTSLTTSDLNYVISYRDKAKADVDNIGSSILTSNISYLLGGFFINRALEKYFQARNMEISSLYYPTAGLKISYKF